MKFTRLRQLIVATFAICGLALGGQTAAHASTKAPDKVTIQLHKVDNEATQMMQNTGDEMTLQSGMSVYDATKYGDVTYSIYDVSSLLKDRGVENGKVTNEAFTTERDKLIHEITGGKTDPAEVLKAQQAFVEEKKLDAVATKTLRDKSGFLTFADLNNRGFYLIMEMAAPTHHLTGLSAPMIIGLPLNEKSEIHLYPKNLIARDVDPEIHKVGIDPNAPTSDTHIALGLVEFTLEREDGAGETRTLVTDDKGNIEFGGLEVGTVYVLTESSNAKHPWYYQSSDKTHKISLKFTVDKAGNVDPKEMLPSEKDFKISGTKIGILNHLILGGAQFQKVDATDTAKGLAGAEFKVQKIDHAGKIFWAVFDGQTFVKWVSNKDKATVLTSDKDGKFDFNGVPYVYDKRDGAVTYNLVETKAPRGYALLKRATSFKVNEQQVKKIKNTKDVATGKNGSGGIGDKIRRGFLPTTGGMGIWFFLLLGGLLMGGAGYLYYRQRKAK
ncbi:SpaA isopeptide-forming pilin-related protein [Levilactobacillus huananensis]|uniref:SpaA isopeptide-forming pilin-related protein n=1 Tax=Levilactobacillus huananensis TaxID=2486019 RepID=UPI000F77DA28|nr:SpaA isopeptide-forming pilin-related protein [Levilactobacillus huananensis]